jgi:hypothetical protein
LHCSDDSDANPSELAEGYESDRFPPQKSAFANQSVSLAMEAGVFTNTRRPIVVEIGKIIAARLFTALCNSDGTGSNNKGGGPSARNFAN